MTYRDTCGALHPGTLEPERWPLGFLPLLHCHWGQGELGCIVGQEVTESGLQVERHAILSQM